MSRPTFRRVELRVDGQPVEAFDGVTVAAALVGAGIWQFRRSIRGEPRGPVCGMGICDECRVTIDGIAHRRACLEPVADGMEIERSSGSLGDVFQFASSQARNRAMTDRFDVAVVGGGPAGIAATVRAAEGGGRVVLIDEAPRPGGQIWRHMARDAVRSVAQRWLDRLDNCGATVVSGACVVDATPGFNLTIEQGAEPRRIEASSVILATGARERFLPFPGWTLPGVVGAGGAQALLKTGADLRGRRAVITGTGPLLLAVAGALARGGVRVSWVAEQAPAARVYAFGASLWESPGRLAQALRERVAARRARYAMGTWVERADGDGVVRSATLTNGKRSWTVPCDLLCTGFGLIPSTELARAVGCSVLRGRVLVDAHQRTSVAGVLCAGEPTGVAGAESAVVQGEIAGFVASGNTAAAHDRFAARDTHRAFVEQLDSTFVLRPELRGLPAPDTIVCRCEDVPFNRFDPDWTSREAKLRTRAGMGPCQGRVCSGALEFLLGYRPDTVRPPISPARAETLAQH